MGLETGTYISDLVATNPLGSDAKSQGDDHIRLIKSTVKASFTGVTGAVSATHTELNRTVALQGRNKIINGNFDIWQLATSQTTNASDSDDMWYNNHSGSTKTHSQQAFTVGQTDVPYNPKYYSRTVVTSSAGASNYVLKAQRIEGVRTFAGRTVTLTFYAKADASKNIAVEFFQSFGTGGSPSSDNPSIGVTTCALTTSWTKFTVTKAIDSISAKTLGTNGDDYLAVRFWFDAGSSFNSNTNSLGQQSGTFEIAQVQLEDGSVASVYENRSLSEELSLCERYLEKSYELTTNPGSVSNVGYERVYAAGQSSATRIMVVPFRFKTRKRTAPTMTFYSPPTGTSGKIRDASAASDESVSSSVIGQTGGDVTATQSGSTTTIDWKVHWVADARV